MPQIVNEEEVKRIFTFRRAGAKAPVVQDRYSSYSNKGGM